MATTVDLTSSTPRTCGEQFVYLKEKWTDEWVLYYDLHCLSAVWSLSPTMPTATLTFDYGHIKGFGSTDFAVVQKLSVAGWYVKIVMVTNVSTADSCNWYGVVGHVEDEPMSGFGIPDEDGKITNVPIGRQTVHCYGLEKLLDTEYLSESWVDVGDAKPAVVQLPATFNKNGKPNRNDRLIGGADAYLFEGQTINPGGTLRPTAKWWGTLHIVQYLLKWVTPKDSFRTLNARLPFELHPSSVGSLAVLDRPELEQEGQTILSLLNKMIDRRRLRGFRLSVDTTRTPNVIQLVVYPWNGEQIDTGIADTDILKPNASKIAIQYAYKDTSISLRKTRVHRYDRVLVRGARRTSTASWVVATGYLEANWTSAEETAYENAASGVAGYAGWDDLTQQQRNAEVRSSAELSPVYSWFKLPDSWTGLTELANGTTTYPVFLAADGISKEKQYIHEVVWESQVPLYERVDYSGTLTGDEDLGDVPVQVYRRPAVYFKVPTDARWVAGDAVAHLGEASADPAGDGRNFRWSAVVYTQPESRTLEVRVSGEQQHVIASSSFTALAEDRDLGTFDYASKNMAITATLRDNRYAEGKYPADGFGDTTMTDAQFGFVIYAGDDYRQDYVVPGTIVDVATDGTLVVSSGGFVRDDTGKLDALARIAYEWWHQERIILSISTTQLTNAINVGDYIETIGESWETTPDQVNTVVSEIAIKWPKLDGNSLDVPVMQIVTGAGELDPMTLAPKKPEVVTKKEALRR